MKKINNKLKSKDYPITEGSENNKVEEPYAPVMHFRKMPVVADFTYNNFKRIADKIPFTQTEWANILHLSERTLQRYAKDNKSFEGIYVDRILQMENLIDAGLETFHSPNDLYNWLKKTKVVLGSELSFEDLFHSEGIREHYNQLQRIQQGVYS